MDLKSILGMFEKSPLYGTPVSGAPEFDDAQTCAGMGPAFPKQIDFRQGDSLAFRYDAQTLKHGGTGGSPNSFTLAADEHIVRVEGKFSSWGGGTIMDLVFMTDKNRSLGKGRPTPGTEGYFEFRAKEGQAVFGMFGRADHFLRNIGFYARPIESTQGGDIFSGLGSMKFGGK